MDSRLIGLGEWLAELGLVIDGELVPASRDASFRRYFRVPRGDGTAIAMDAPAPGEDLGRFLRIARWLRDHGIRVPEIYAADADVGFALIEDFGTRTLLPELDEHSVDGLYAAAMDELMAFQRLPRDTSWRLPAYDHAFFMREMEIFREWLVTVHLSLPDAPAGLLDRTFDFLAREAEAQPRVVVHRDFHSRNLMILGDGRLGVIDFQDAVSGPLTYDLVSLLRDCYVQWPTQRVDAWARGYFQVLISRGLVDSEWDKDRLLRAFDLMGVQRHLKAAGIFARLLHRDGRDNYLPDIPRTLGYVVQVGDRHPELSELCAWIRGTLSARIEVDEPPIRGLRR